MKIERKQVGDIHIISFAGEFDAFNLPTVSEKIDAFIAKGGTRLVFNLKNLRFINSSALGYFVKTAKVHLNQGASYGKGGENHMRMNIGTSRKLVELALNNMAAACRNPVATNLF